MAASRRGPGPAGGGRSAAVPLRRGRAARRRAERGRVRYGAVLAAGSCPGAPPRAAASGAEVKRRARELRREIRSSVSAGKSCRVTAALGYRCRRTCARCTVLADLEA